MKFALIFKTQNVLDQLDYPLAHIAEGNDDIEQEDLDIIEQECREFANQYIKWSEYIKVEFDTLSRTVKVMANSK
jgi:hypothetical protein